LARERAVDQPGAGGAAHAVGEQGDLAAARHVARVLGLDLLAVPQREVVVERLLVNAARGRGAQAVVVPQARVLDPLRRGGASLAAELARGAGDGAARRGGGQGLGAVVAAGGLPGRNRVRAQGGARRGRAHGTSPASCSAGCRRAASSPRGSLPCRRHSRSAGARRRFQSCPVSTSASTRQPVSDGASWSCMSSEAVIGWLSTRYSGALRTKRPLTG